MLPFNQQSPLGGLWFGPVAFGSLMILTAILIFARPELLAYFVAALLLVVGIALIGLGLSFRGRVTYRRIDDEM